MFRHTKVPNGSEAPPNFSLWSGIMHSTEFFHSNHPGLFGNLFHQVSDWFAAQRAQAETRRAERRLQAELDSMSSRERHEVDVTAGNLALSLSNR
jgi:hypothetical protein